jgi:hypothetical protein
MGSEFGRFRPNSTQLYMKLSSNFAKYLKHGSSCQISMIFIIIHTRLEVSDYDGGLLCDADYDTVYSGRWVSALRRNINTSARFCLEDLGSIFVRNVYVRTRHHGDVVVILTKCFILLVTSGYKEWNCVTMLPVDTNQLRYWCVVQVPYFAWQVLFVTARSACGR